MEKVEKSQKDVIKNDTDKLIEARSAFYDYLDTHIPKNRAKYVLRSHPKLDAKDIYALFYKLDYQARKLRGHLVKAYNLKAE